MDKRIVVFLVLSLAVILGWDLLVKELGLAPPPPADNVQDHAPIQTEPGQPVSSPVAGKEEELHPGSLQSGSSDGGRSVRKEDGTGQPAVQEDTHEVVTDLYRAVFTNRGGELQSWQLTRYQTAGNGDQQPIQLVYGQAKFRKPLSLHLADPNASKAVNDALYEVEHDFTRLDSAHPTGHLRFRYTSPDSPIRVEKELTFHHNSYLVDVVIKTEGLPDGFDVGLGTNFGIVEWGEGFIGLIGPASVVDDKLVKDTPDNELERKGNVRWVGLQDKYFISVFIPTNATAALVKKEGEKLVSARAHFASSGGMGSAAMQLYAGPKEYDTLRGLNIGLEDTIDFGWFIYGSWDIVRAVAKPLFYVLRFLYEFTHNYGVSIILLTVGIKLLFVPLQYKSYKSMKEMQLVQPKVVQLQQKYKDDRERLNKELIKLYRDHKVNPVGGCLPMVLQTPVFVALFNILYMTIDLRQAPFILWIKDLSVQDPYYVLPILMGISMIVQQKIMPTTMDPTQAKIMLVLPAFMTLLFLTFPSGLVLYWLTNNVLTITQQFVTDRYIFRRPTFSSPAGDQQAGGDSGDKGRQAPQKKSKSGERPEPESPAES
jgi:YidC/Oxa1 family membrane protein insertase